MSRCGATLTSNLFYYLVEIPAHNISLILGSTPGTSWLKPIHAMPCVYGKKMFVFTCEYSHDPLCPYNSLYCCLFKGIHNNANLPLFRNPETHSVTSCLEARHKCSKTADGYVWHKHVYIARNRTLPCHIFKATPSEEAISSLWRVIYLASQNFNIRCTYSPRIHIPNCIQPMCLICNRVWCSRNSTDFRTINRALSAHISRFSASYGYGGFIRSISTKHKSEDQKWRLPSTHGPDALRWPDRLAKWARLTWLLSVGLSFSLGHVTR